MSCDSRACPACCPTLPRSCVHSEQSMHRVRVLATARRPLTGTGPPRTHIHSGSLDQHRRSPPGLPRCRPSSTSRIFPTWTPTNTIIRRPLSASDCYTLHFSPFDCLFLFNTSFLPLSLAFILSSCPPKVLPRCRPITQATHNTTHNHNTPHQEHTTLPMVDTLLYTPLRERNPSLEYTPLNTKKLRTMRGQRQQQQRSNATQSPRTSDQST